MAVTWQWGQETVGSAFCSWETGSAGDWDIGTISLYNTTNQMVPFLKIQDGDNVQGRQRGQDKDDCDAGGRDEEGEDNSVESQGGEETEDETD